MTNKRFQVLAKNQTSSSPAFGRIYHSEFVLQVLQVLGLVPTATDSQETSLFLQLERHWQGSSQPRPCHNNFSDVMRSTAVSGYLWEAQLEAQLDPNRAIMTTVYRGVSLTDITRKTQDTKRCHAIYHRRG